MINEIIIDGLKCVYVKYPNVGKVAYMIYPEIVPLDEKWLNEMSEKYKVPIVVIYIPAEGWNNMLTPWPNPGETPDSPSFAGDSAKTLKTIQENIIPEMEKLLGFQNIEDRALIGVSLSGLFTLWEWLQCNTFRSIASLSGSFWYPGFLKWFENQTIPSKTGKAYFLLGVKEPKAWIKAYRSVGVCTEKIVEKLKDSGITTIFEWVPGDHKSNPLIRAEDAFKTLFPIS